MYLSPEDYEVAKSNGISYDNAYNRVYILGWEVERAITTPIIKPNAWGQYKDKCEKLGIGQNTFYQRIHKGETPEEASSYPPLSRKKKTLKGSGVIKLKHMKLAEENGIPYKTVVNRVYMLRWNVERAVTEPIRTQHRRKGYETTSIRP